MPTVIRRPAALGIMLLALVLPAARAIAEDAARVTAGEVARPSVEELALPKDDSQDEDKAEVQKPADTARETDTRNGQRALGIAQFMPGTANERRLLDPFDPVQALPKSAEFLNELRNQFGNLGLAAAAYNAGPRRVQEWLDGSGPMPQETRNYVFAITGTSVDDWAAAGKNGKPPDRAPTSSCRAWMALLRR